MNRRHKPWYLSVLSKSVVVPGWLLGALLGAAIPLLFILFVILVNRFDSEVMFILIPGTLLVIVCAGLGVLIGGLFIW